MDFSLSFFSAAGDSSSREKYRLLLDAVRFADEAGFRAVWLPERHFHRFGGLYPNPSVLAAAVATVTSRLTVRAGSVVLPLHHAIRVAEDWSIVDNLSGGRVEISFASGWQRNDFALAPENYRERKAVLESGIDRVRRLWRGEAVEFPLGDGLSVPVTTFPRPLQPELPVWLTSAGSPGTAELAGRLGAGLLTHLVGQTYDGLAALIARYREASTAATGGPGRVALMLHTFLGKNGEDAIGTARQPLKRYLASAADLRSGARDRQMPTEHLTEDDWDVMLDHAVRRYLDTGALIGDVASCRTVVSRAAAAGVDEISCLVDFVDSADDVLAALPLLDELRRQSVG
jgi:natural product biosynthesis luciferase-like monooxygenase protein